MALQLVLKTKDKEILLGDSLSCGFITSILLGEIDINKLKLFKEIGIDLNELYEEIKDFNLSTDSENECLDAIEYFRNSNVMIGKLMAASCKEGNFIHIFAREFPEEFATKFKTLLIIACKYRNLYAIKFLLSIEEQFEKRNDFLQEIMLKKSQDIEMARIFASRMEISTLNKCLELSIKNGNIELVDFFLKCGAGSRKITTFKSLEFVKKLIDRGFEIERSNAMEEVVKCTDTNLMEFLYNFISPSNKDKEHLIKNGNMQFINFLLEKEKSTSQTFNDNSAYLSFAIMTNNYDFVKDLLERGFECPDIFEIRDTGINTFNLDIIKLLLDYGIVPNYMNVYRAASKKQYHLAKFLIEHGIFHSGLLNHALHFNNSPEEIDFVKYLIQKQIVSKETLLNDLLFLNNGQYLEIVGQHEFLSEEKFCETFRTSVNFLKYNTIKYLMKSKLFNPVKYEDVFINLCCRGNIDLIKEFLNYDLGSMKNRALKQVISVGQIDVMNLLIDNGADINSPE